MKKNKIVFLISFIILFGSLFLNQLLSQKNYTSVYAASDDIFNLSAATMFCTNESTNFTESHNEKLIDGSKHYIFNLSYDYDNNSADFTFDFYNISTQVYRSGSISYDYKITIANMVLDEEYISLGIPSVSLGTYTNFLNNGKQVTNYYEPLGITNYPNKNAFFSGTVTQKTNRDGNNHGDNANGFEFTIMPYTDSYIEMGVKFSYDLSSYHGTIDNNPAVGDFDGGTTIGSTIAVTILAPVTIIASVAISAIGSSSGGFSVGGMSYDSAGDIKVIDPVTNKESIYVSNGDGTYTDPITNITGTKEEIESSQAFKYEHIGELNEEHVKDVNFNEQAYEDNLKATDDTEYKKLKEEQKHQEYIDEIKEKHHFSDDASIGAVKNELAHEQELNEIKGERYMEESKELDRAIEVNEKIEKASDDFFAAVENDPTGVGKIGSAVYKATKDITETMAEKGVSAESALEGTLKATTDVTTTMTNSSAVKISATFVGNTASETVAGLAEGKEIGDALCDATKKATAESAYTAVSEGVDKLIPDDPVLKGIKNVADNEYHNEVVSPGIEKAMDKKD